MSSNSERVKRWREKNRGLFNLRRRKAYQERKNLSGVVESGHEHNVKEVARDTADLPHQSTKPEDRSGSSAPPAQNPTIQALRQLIATPPKAEPKPSIYRNDHGQVISERVWKQLQERKAKAKAGNYVLDEYSQT